jgi:hypothetical protein
VVFQVFREELDILVGLLAILVQVAIGGVLPTVQMLLGLVTFLMLITKHLGVILKRVMVSVCAA